MGFDVEKIAMKEGAMPLNESCLLGGCCGDLVKVRPCASRYGGKTYLGILIGEAAMGVHADYQEQPKQLDIAFCSYNPVIFIPELKKLVYGMESWWSRIKSKDDLKDITDGDIQNVWYVQILKNMPEEDEAKD